MSLDKLQQAWKDESSLIQVEIDMDQLSKEIQQSQEVFQTTIFWRDVREVGTALTMVPIWIVMGFALSMPWTWYLTIPALVWVAVFMLVDRKRHPQTSSEPGEPLLFYAKESLSQVEHQIWLLRNVFWWYLVPYSISLMAFFLQVSWESTGVWWAFAIVASGFGAFLLVIYGWVYRLNQTAVREQLEPRRKDLNQLVANLESDGESCDVVQIVTSLSGTEHNAGLSSSWVDNWNSIIPSWREVALVMVPTLTGAFLGWEFPIPDMGPVFFQSVVAAVIPFEVVFFTLWWRCSKRKKQEVENDPKPAGGCELEEGVVDDDGVSTSPSETSVRLPGAPAMVILTMIIVLSILAVAALAAFTTQ